MKLEVGLLINFGTATLKEGLQRIVKNYQSSASSRLRVNQRSTLSMLDLYLPAQFSMDDFLLVREKVKTLSAP
ncbi:MAG TPA: hypothetical protein VK469_12750 [Candidatus Kapabacteria bacterium]|nr:hypothetical protein [Candidatus Kapabacteria bacterium]